MNVRMWTVKYSITFIICTLGKCLNLIFYVDLLEVLSLLVQPNQKRAKDV